MTRIHVLEIPDDPARLPSWLEEQVVGLNLSETVAELEAAHGVKPRSSLEQIVGDRLGAVLDEGLGVLPADTLVRFLSHSRALLQLQELVLVEGTSHWAKVADDIPELADAVGRGRQRFAAFLNAQGSSVPTTAPAWHRRPTVVSFMTAAAVLMAVFVSERLTRPTMPAQAPAMPAQAGWGWNDPSALSGNVEADIYLEQLADGANAWFGKRPRTRPALAKRVLEFRLGCSRLLFAEHRPLADEDRVWLVEKCRLWSGKIDGHLVALEAGRDPVVVGAEMDETVVKLVAALRARGAEIRGS